MSHLGYGHSVTGDVTMGLRHKSLQKVTCVYSVIEQGCINLNALENFMQEIIHEFIFHLP
jgi:hypothetical protein